MISRAKGTIAVDCECLVTYDPTNDRKDGNALKTSEVPVQPGSSGAQIQLKCDMLLEGFRPTKIVRFYPATLPFVTQPMDESFFGRNWSGVCKNWSGVCKNRSGVCKAWSGVRKASSGVRKASSGVRKASSGACKPLEQHAQGIGARGQTSSCA